MRLPPPAPRFVWRVLWSSHLRCSGSAARPGLVAADLVRLYGVVTKALNQAVCRNQDRFPEDFRFQLTVEEKSELVANCDHLENLKFAKTFPYTYTEHGALMTSNVLNAQEKAPHRLPHQAGFVGMKTPPLHSRARLETMRASYELERLDR